MLGVTSESHDEDPYAMGVFLFFFFFFPPVFSEPGCLCARACEGERVRIGRCWAGRWGSSVEELYRPKLKAVLHST